MSETFTAASGRKVVSRASAEEVGSVSHLVVDAADRVVSTIVVGKGRRAQLVDFSKLSGFGADAVMITDEDALRAPSGEREEDAAKGHLEPIGRLALSDLGHELGNVEEIAFDPATGVIESVTVAGEQHPGEALLGVGGYAVVLQILPSSA